MSNIISNRYEFVYLFDVENGNPNGDPDAGNMPRIDPETNYGLVTDVCLKRKIRNFVTISKSGEAGFNIYVQEGAILNKQHELAYKALELEVEKKKLPKKEEDALKVTKWMCQNFYDVRTFGAVMTTDVNCGQVTGPIQLNFAHSIEPIVPLEVTITRMAVATEGEFEKQKGGGKAQTMGRKHIVPYGLYRAEGYISANLAQKTGFSEDDLALLWESLQNMFDHDHSAARGKMAARKLIVFKHDSPLGNAPAHKLFELVKVEPNHGDAPARRFENYKIEVGQAPDGVELIEML